MCNFDESSLTKTTSRGKFYLSVYCLLELKCQVVRAEIGFKMCRFPSVGSVDLRLAPLITFACGCHRSEKAASSPDQKECKVATGWGIESPNAGSNHSLVGEPLLIRTVLFSHFFCLAQINLHDWFWGDFSTLFRACKIDIPTTEATSVQCSVLPWRELLSVVMPFQLSFDRPLSKLLTTHFNTQNQRNFWDEA